MMTPDAPRRRVYRLLDGQRSADREQPGQLDDLPVRHPDATVRGMTGDQRRLVRAVDADHATARPVGFDVGQRRGPERDRSKDAAGRKAVEPVADVELP